MSAVELGAEIKAAIDTYVGSEVFGEQVRADALQKLVDALAATPPKCQLLDLVLHLEPAIKDASNPLKRRQAVNLLGACLESHRKLQLNWKHVDTLITFFCSKLSDWQCVEGAMRGLLVLARSYAPVIRTLKAEEDEPIIVKVVRTLFKEVHTPSHSQSVRKIIFDFMHILLSNWSDETATLKTAVGDGISAAIEEERDPRNLLLSFNLVRKLIENMPKECISDKAIVSLFETLTSYFPITFSPPKDDKFGITGDDLRNAMNRALVSSPRLSQHVVPFFIESSKDINADDWDAVAQALEVLSFCLESYRPEVAQEHLRSVLKNAHDQVCRTNTPRPSDFATAVRRALAAAFRGVPAGLHPHWLDRDVEPMLKTLAEDVCRGEASLSSKGSRLLLMAMAAAHQALLNRVLSLTCSLSSSAEQLLASEDSLTFTLDLVRLAEDQTNYKTCPLAPRQLRPTLASALEALQGMKPETAVCNKAQVMLELIGTLCCLVSVDSSRDGFEVMRLMLLPSSDPVSGSADLLKWSEGWRKFLADAEDTDPCRVALVTAVGKVAGLQVQRAAELSPALIRAAPVKGSTSMLLPSWVESAIPRLLVISALSLAGQAASAEGSAEHDPDAEEARRTASKLLGKAADLVQQPGAISLTSLQALTEALEDSPIGGPAATSWAALSFPQT